MRARMGSIELRKQCGKKRSRKIVMTAGLKIKLEAISTTVR
jgi:hypothetical protein